MAPFAIDELLDYRSRRPPRRSSTDHFTDYDDPQLNLYALHDSVGTLFLLLAGLEPDLRWERSIGCGLLGRWPGCAARSAWAPSRWRCRTPVR